MTEQLQMIAALAAFAVLIFFGGLAAWFSRSQEVKRLRRFVASRSTGGATGGAPGGPQPLKLGSEAPAIAVGLSRRLGHSSFAQELQLQLVRSGLSMSANQFILGQIVAGAVLFVVGRYVLFSSHGTMALLLATALAAPAFFVPRFVLKFLQNRRVTKFETQLAHAIDIMAGGLSAGTSLPQALELVSREMPPPIGDEFGRVVQESSLAVPLDQALLNMLQRVPSMDLEMLVSAINIQYRVGGNLSHILKTIAHTIRERVRIRGELSTLTAQARLSSYIITGMPVVVVLALFLLSPNYIMKLFDEGITRVMLIAGIVGIAAGYYVMKRIATIEV